MQVNIPYFEICNCLGHHNMQKNACIFWRVQYHHPDDSISCIDMTRDYSTSWKHVDWKNLIEDSRLSIWSRFPTLLSLARINRVILLYNFNIRQAPAASVRVSESIVEYRIVILRRHKERTGEWGMMGGDNNAKIPFRLFPMASQFLNHPQGWIQSKKIPFQLHCNFFAWDCILLNKWGYEVCKIAQFWACLAFGFPCGDQVEVVTLPLSRMTIKSGQAVIWLWIAWWLL